MRSSIIIAAFCVSSCALTHVRQHPPVTHHPVRVLTLHGDTGFTGLEQAWIDDAVKDINRQTSGLVMVSVDYDLDFDDTGSIVRLRTADMLIRAPDTADYVKVEDTNDSLLLGTVRGISMSAYDPEASKRVFIVADRLTDHDTFVHVVQHEVYHALGLGHVSRSDAVMSGHVAPLMPRTCITVEDAQELCRVITCDVDDVSYCD